MAISKALYGMEQSHGDYENLGSGRAAYLD